ncbi:DUF6230 family protein [Streptomyces varsoviensis]|uniref:DUF6230 family protein n=1 Tax=Streptomyces varsoviensis TaxID=67373 RepID=UPI0033E8EA86
MTSQEPGGTAGYGAGAGERTAGGSGMGAMGGAGGITGGGAAGRRRGRTDWRRLALAAPLALALAAGSVWATTASAVPVTFAVSGSTFQVAAAHLAGKDAVQFASFATDAAGKRRPVAVAGIGSARISHLCQSSVAHTPFGSVTLTIRSGEEHPVKAENLVIDLKRLDGDLRFGRVQMGRDAGSLDAVEGVRGDRGTYGQQARTLDIDRMRLRAWSLTAGTFSLRGASMAISPGDHSCL